MRYAAQTEVSSEKSKAEIEKLLTRYGATSFASGWQGDLATIIFSMAERRIKFVLPLPKRDARQFTHSPKQGYKRSDADAYKAWEQATRQRWRALALVVKASKNDSDTAAVLYVSEADGLTLVNGAAYTTPAHGVITVTDATAGNITLTIHATAMALLSPGVRVYDVQYVLADGTVRSTPASPFTVSADVNRAVS